MSTARCTATASPRCSIRKAKGEDTAQIEMPAAKGANVIQLERRGNVFIFSAARFGEPFEVAEIKDVPTSPEEAYVGLFLSSHNPDVKETVVFRHVRVIKPVKVGFQPYRDYIGSRLEVLNVTRRPLAMCTTPRACRSKRPTGCPTAPR